MCGALLTTSCSSRASDRVHTVIWVGLCSRHHVHKDYIDSLDLVATANEFVRDSEYRLSTFRKFTSLGSFCFKRDVCK